MIFFICAGRETEGEGKRCLHLYAKKCKKILPYFFALISLQTMQDKGSVSQ